MFFSEDSPLRNIPTTVPKKTALFLDGIRYSLEILAMSIRRLEGTLEAIAQGDLKGDALVSHITSAIADAWLSVDSLHRLRELVQELPGLRQKTPEVQLFIRNTLLVEHLRHFVQHLRTEMVEAAGGRLPVWGTLSWSRTNAETGLPETHTVVPGILFHQVSAFSCTFDKGLGRFVERILLHAGSHRVDVANLVDHAESFGRWLETWAEQKYGRGDRAGGDLYAMFFVQPIVRERGDAT